MCVDLFTHGARMRSECLRVPCGFDPLLPNQVVRIGSVTVEGKRLAHTMAMLEPRPLQLTFRRGDPLRTVLRVLVEQRLAQLKGAVWTTDSGKLSWRNTRVTRTHCEMLENT